MLGATITILDTGEFDFRFRYPIALKSHLRRLNDMIGMEEIKDRIAMMIQKHVVREHDKSVDEGENFSHIVIVGNPGTGKTTIAEIVATIIYAIGWLEQPTTQPTASVKRETDDFLDTINIICETKLRDAEAQKKKLVTVTCIVNDMSRIISSMEPSNEVDELRARVDIYNKVMSDSSKSPRLPKPFNVEPNFKPIYVEAKRKDLISNHVGGTAQLVASKVNEAMGGVLFIDEAHNLVNRGDSGEVESFSKECVSTLCEMMSKYSRNFVCIMSGYPGETTRALMVDMGFERRIPYTFNIPDYTETDVAAIFTLQLKRAGLRLHSDINVIKFVKDNSRLLGYNGAVTGKLIPLIGNYYSVLRFHQIFVKDVDDSGKGVVTTEMLNKSMEDIRKLNSVWSPTDTSTANNTMYG
jgi:SpoVK/Ycf46/Vps4 family AAA+-type ATPase